MVCSRCVYVWPCGACVCAVSRLSLQSTVGPCMGTWGASCARPAQVPCPVVGRTGALPRTGSRLPPCLPRTCWTGACCSPSWGCFASGPVSVGGVPTARATLVTSACEFLGGWSSLWCWPWHPKPGLLPVPRSPPPPVFTPHPVPLSHPLLCPQPSLRIAPNIRPAPARTASSWDLAVPGARSR